MINFLCSLENVDWLGKAIDLLNEVHLCGLGCMGGELEHVTINALEEYINEPNEENLDVISSELRLFDEPEDRPWRFMILGIVDFISFGDSALIKESIVEFSKQIGEEKCRNLLLNKD